MIPDINSTLTLFSDEWVEKVKIQLIMKVVNKFTYLHIKLVTKGGTALIFNSDSRGYLPRRIFRFIRKWERNATNILLVNKLLLLIWRLIWKHTKEKGYKCVQCVYKSSQEANLKAHMKALGYNSVAQRPDFESALRVLKRCCGPFLVYIYDIQFDLMPKITRNTQQSKSLISLCNMGSWALESTKLNSPHWGVPKKTKVWIWVYMQLTPLVFIG